MDKNKVRGDFMDFDIPSGAKHILQSLTAAGHEAYFVGGCVRDLLRGVPPHDWDICTSARPEETAACFTGRRVLKTGLRHGTVTVRMDGESYEITTWRTEGPYSDSRRPDYVRFVTDLRKDLARRDFTINAIALGMDGTLRDPFGGADDIRAGQIRCVGDPARRFQEDGLRLMRALRFASVLCYSIEGLTAQAIHSHRAMLDKVALERIQVELCKLLTGQNAGDVLRQYPDVLCQFWPELGPLIPLAQNNPWHCWGGWEHTIHALEAAPADTVLRLTMLLHDIGKPQCKSTDENGIDHFYGHPAVSAELAEKLLRKLKFDRAAIKQVVTLVKHHDAPLPRDGKDIRRWLNRLGPETFFRLLEVKRADMLGHTPGKTTAQLAELAEIRAEAEQIVAERQCFARKDLAVNGKDIIAAGAVPGPAVGRILDRLLEQVLNGELPNRREVLLEQIEHELSGGVD